MTNRDFADRLFELLEEHGLAYFCSNANGKGYDEVKESYSIVQSGDRLYVTVKDTGGFDEFQVVVSRMP